MVVDVGFAFILVYLLVWVRLAGMIVFNPLFSRNGVPAIARTGIALFMGLMIAPMQPEAVFTAVYDMSTFGYVIAVVAELFIGLVYGYVFQVFYYLIFFVGDLIDTDIGLSMAKTFDPGSNIQTGFSASLLTTLFALYIVVTGSHLVIFRIFAESFTALPPGMLSFSTTPISYALQLFTRIFSLVMRLAAPFMVAEFILQFSLGILMKFIPQITVFVINFQLRIILGLIMLYSFAPYIGQFIDTYIDSMFAALLDLAPMMASGGG